MWHAKLCHKNEVWKKKSDPLPHNAQNYNWVVLFKKRWELQVDFNIPNKQNKFKFKHNVLPPLI